MYNRANRSAWTYAQGRRIGTPSDVVTASRPTSTKVVQITAKSHGIFSESLYNNNL
jgi:hypothetical protein